MTSARLKLVLVLLYDAGASRVPAKDIEWTPEMVPEINKAVTMQYMIWRETDGGRIYSLTAAGYSAIGHDRPSIITSLMRFIRG